MSSRPLTKILIILVVLVAAFFLYRYLFVSSAPAETPGLQAVGSPRFGEAGMSNVSGQPSAADDEFIGLLERLQGVKLDSGFFASPAWKSLINFRVELVPEDKGRYNPFSPVGFDFSSLVSTSTATTTRTRTTTTPRR